MTLHRIDYNGGEIWVDKSKPDISEYGGEIVGQSIFKAPLPNIPYVEIEEHVNIDNICNKVWNKLIPKGWEPTKEWEAGFHNGYKAASAKGKYTEEDLRKAWNSGFEYGLSDGGSHVGGTDEESFIQSLQPNVASIEIETKRVVDVDAREKAISQRKSGENAWMVEYIDVPVTYTKELRGKMETFLKVKKVNYESR